MTDPINRHLSEAHMKAVDRDYWDPAERAQGVHQIVWSAIEKDREEHGEKAPTNWDVACWALNYLAQFAMGLEFEPLTKAVRALNGILWSIHYSNFKELYGAPDKRKHRGVSREGVSIPSEGRPSIPLSPQPDSPVHWEGSD